MTAPPLRLGLIGLDTSHVEGFALLLNDPEHPDHLPGACIVAGYPGGSADFALSAGRVEEYTRRLRDRYGVSMLESPAEVAAAVDAILLSSIDGRVHREQFVAIAPCRRPVYINKPFATSLADAQAIADLSRLHGTPVFTSSSLRYAGALRSALADDSGGQVVGADFHGPLPLEPTQPGFFWYGIHVIEMLYAAMGPGCRRLWTTSTPDHEVVTAEWNDGRIGVVRGLRGGGKHTFGGIVYREKTTQFVDTSTGVAADIGLTREILRFFLSTTPPVPLAESIEIVRFIEAANESKSRSGKEIVL